MSDRRTPEGKFLQLQAIREKEEGEGEEEETTFRKGRITEPLDKWLELTLFTQNKIQMTGYII